MHKVATYLDYFALVENAHSTLMHNYNNYSLLCTITGSGHVVMQRQVKVEKSQLTAELTNHGFIVYAASTI